MTSTSNENPTAAVVRFGLAVLLAAVFLALYPYSQQPSADIKHLLVSIGAGVLALIYVGGSVAGRVRPRSMGFVMRVLLILGVVFVVSGMASDHPLHSFYHLTRFLPMVVLAYLASQVITRAEHIGVVMGGAVLGMALASVYALAQFFGYDPFPWEATAKFDEAYTGLPATFGNANLAAHVLAVTLVASLGLAWTARKMRWVYGGLAVLFLVYLLYTGQRGSLVALSAAAVFLGLVAILGRRVSNPVARVAYGFMGLGAIAALAGGVLIAASMILSDRPLPVDTSLLLRYNAFYGASEMIVDRPLMGFGPGNYVIENTPYWTPYEQRWFAERLQYNAHVHNDLLETAVETGVIGGAIHLILFLAAIGLPLIWALRGDGLRRRWGVALSAMALVFFVDGLFGFNLRVPASGLFVFVLFGLVDGVSGRVAAPPLGRWRAWGSHAVLAVAVATVVVTGVRQFVGSVYLKEAIAARDHEAYEISLAAFERADSYRPWDWVAPWEKGRLFLGTRHFADAVKAIDVALDRNPYYVPAHAGIGQAYLGTLSENRDEPMAVQDEIFERAEDAAKRTTELCPMLPSGQELHGRLSLLMAQRLEQEGDTEGARAGYVAATEHLRKALVYGGDGMGSTYLLLFQAHLALDETGAAEEAIAESAKRMPENEQVWIVFFAYAVQHDRHDFFRATLLDAVKERDGPLPLSVDASATFWQEGPGALPDIAQRFAETAERLAGEGAGPYTTRSLIWGLNLVSFAAQRSETLTPETRALTLYRFARAYQPLGATRRAVDLMQRALPDLPRDEQVTAAMFLTSSYWNKQQFDAAVSLMEDMKVRASNNSDVWIMLARSYAKAGRREEALDTYRYILMNFRYLPEEVREGIEREYDMLREEK